MNFTEMVDRAVEIRAKYNQLEKKKYGRAWTTAELGQGLVGDVGDLSKLILAKEGIRDIQEVDPKLAHELSDCLWAILVLAHEYGIDLGQSFVKTMNELEQKISKDS